jgi:Ca2+:H+ antiporter
MGFADHIFSGARAQATGADPRKDQPILPVSEPQRQSSDAVPLQAIAVQGEESKSTNEKSPSAAKDGSDRQQSPVESSTVDHPPPPGKPPILIRMKRGSGRFWGHTKNALTHSYVNVLLVFVPIGIATKYAHLNAAVVFAMNAVAIIPLAGLLTHATESIAMRLGDTVGALLNVSFGNAVELIIL